MCFKTTTLFQCYYFLGYQGMNKHPLSVLEVSFIHNKRFFSEVAI